jgi:hypothetical protein
MFLLNSELVWPGVNDSILVIAVPSRYSEQISESHINLSDELIKLPNDVYGLHVQS